MDSGSRSLVRGLAGLRPSLRLVRECVRCDDTHAN